MHSADSAPPRADPSAKLQRTAFCAESVPNGFLGRIPLVIPLVSSLCNRMSTFIQQSMPESSSMARESNGAVPSTVKYYRPEVYFEQSRMPAATSTNTAQNKRVPAPSDASSSISPPHAPTEAPTNAAQDTHIPHPAIPPLVSQPEPPVLDDRYPRFELLQYCVFPPKAFPKQNYFADPPI